MANIRVQVANFAAGALPVDYCVNTVYFTGTPPATDTAWLSFLTAVVGAWTGTSGLASGNFTAKAYDMADAKPRPIKAQYSVTGPGSPSGPTEVALCLSYFSTRNLPRFRGRIYMGPYSGGSTSEARPAGSILTGVRTLGQRIKDAGDGAGLVWSLHSVKDNDYLAITDVWVDNAWDTQRRRGLKATTRLQTHLT